MDLPPAYDDGFPGDTLCAQRAKKGKKKNADEEPFPFL